MRTQCFLALLIALIVDLGRGAWREVLQSFCLFRVCATSFVIRHKDYALNACELVKFSGCFNSRLHEEIRGVTVDSVSQSGDQQDRWGRKQREQDGRGRDVKPGTARGGQCGWLPCVRGKGRRCALRRIVLSATSAVGLIG